ncbi:glycosyltransferase [Cerasicoccus fimbriatus]|uniref:glycosyltransferase n=1 Tax=Cerasicoccus fimbriatus TaxID=3014554 RepID=UPI0022B30140|nr:glycosyltransferase [Cerasicoccus sp. TK19100]
MALALHNSGRSIPDMPPQVSVLLPVRNAEDTLELAVRSIMAQSLYAWELLLVDDHSTDSTGAIARKLSQADPRIRCQMNPGRGIVDALNFAIQSSEGRYLVRMDADDIATFHRLETQIRFLEENPDIGIVGSCVTYIGDREKFLGYANYVDWINSLITPADIERYRFVESPFAHPSVAFRRSVVEEFGGYKNGDFPEDYELWLRWADAGVRMGKCPEFLLHWRDSETRLSRTDPRYDVDVFYQLKAYYLHRWLKRTFARRELYVWGAGRTTRKRLQHLRRLGVKVAAFIDIDPNKIGQEIEGISVRSPDELPEPGPAGVIIYVGSRGARELIEQGLQTRGYRLGVDYIPAA